MGEELRWWGSCTRWGSPTILSPGVALKIDDPRIVNRLRWSQHRGRWYMPGVPRWQSEDPERWKRVRAGYKARRKKSPR